MGCSYGSVNPETGKAAAGALICDSLGRALSAFSVSLSVCSITQTELRAVVTGL